MSDWLNEWVAAGTAAKERAARQTCECGTQKVSGYSNLGIPIVVCPKCSPWAVRNGKRSFDEVFGVAS